LFSGLLFLKHCIALHCIVSIAFLKKTSILFSRARGAAMFLYYFELNFSAHPSLQFVIVISTLSLSGTALGILQISHEANSVLKGILHPRLYSKVWPMLSIFDSNKQKTPLEISVVFDRWGAVL
jgi:hypothetical protein